MSTDLTLADIHLTDPAAFAQGVPHHWFTYLRTHAPVCWIDEPDGPGFWAVTSHPDCTTVNRDYAHFSSSARATFIWELPPDDLATQQMLMLNMDPPLHTRYRRLINKGFTPRMVASLHAQIHRTADLIIDSVIEHGHADFVTDIAAQLPLTVIADLLGVPPQDRIRMFDWSNQMVGNADPEYQLPGTPTGGPTIPTDSTIATAAAQASFELYAYASQLFALKAANPQADLMSVLTQVDIAGERLSPLELELFFLLLTVAGNETTRNLIAGAASAFFDHPDQWQLLRANPSQLPSAVEEMLRYVSPVMNFRRQSTTPFVLGGQTIEADQKVVFFHVSANRDEAVFVDPQRFDITRTPNPHIAFGAGGPHFCLGANLARLEISVMFEHLLARLPDLAPAGPAAHLSSQFINGIKHLPVSFTPGPRLT
jgi:cholest-4-en-3-one 26-monooxygenase